MKWHVGGGITIKTFSTNTELFGNERGTISIEVDEAPAALLNAWLEAGLEYNIPLCAMKVREESAGTYLDISYDASEYSNDIECEVFVNALYTN